MKLSLSPEKVRAGFAIALVSLLVGTACGSTVPAPSSSSGAAGSAPAATGQGGGLSIPTGQSAQGGGGVTTGGTTSGGTVSGGTSATGGGTTTSGGGGSLPTGHGGGGHLAAPESVPGVTATTIYLGSYYNKNTGGGNAAVGVPGLDEGDARKPQNVMIDWVNSHGGVAGRKLVPIYYGYDASGTGPPADQQDQAACAKYTQDNEVFAFLGGGQGSGGVLDECAKKAGAIDFGREGTPSTYRKYPHRVDIDTLNGVRAQKVSVDGYAQLGYWDQGAKIGVVAWDDPGYHEAIDDGLLPALKSHGLSLATPPYYIAVPQTLQDFGASSAAINNAVLKFSALGIDHVLILDGPAGIFRGGGLTIEWLKRADSQQYYPRYGFNDSNLPIELQNLHVLSDRQAQGSVYVNWTDFGEAYEGGLKKNPQQVACLEIMRKHDIDMSNANAKAQALVACTNMWFLQAVGVQLDALNLPLTADNFMTALEHLGYDFLSTTAYANFFGPQQHDGIAGVRHAKFADSCKCYKWIGGVYRTS